MQSITPELTQQQRETIKSFTSPAMLDRRDEFCRLLTQSKALVNMMTANDNLDGIPAQTVSDLLWLLSDRLDDMQASYDRLTGGYVQ